MIDRVSGYLYAADKVTLHDITDFDKTFQSTCSKLGLTNNIKTVRRTTSCPNLLEEGTRLPTNESADISCLFRHFSNKSPIEILDEENTGGVTPRASTPEKDIIVCNELKEIINHRPAGRGNNPGYNNSGYGQQPAFQQGDSRPPYNQRPQQGPPPPPPPPHYNNNWQ